jgi:hypothetical protein
MSLTQDYWAFYTPAARALYLVALAQARFSRLPGRVWPNTIWYCAKIPSAFFPRREFNISLSASGSAVAG